MLLYLCNDMEKMRRTNSCSRGTKWKFETQLYRLVNDPESWDQLRHRLFSFHYVTFWLSRIVGNVLTRRGLHSTDKPTLISTKMPHENTFSVLVLPRHERHHMHLPFEFSSANSGTWLELQIWMEVMTLRYFRIWTQNARNDVVRGLSMSKIKSTQGFFSLGRWHFGWEEQKDCVWFRYKEGLFF